MTNRSKFFDIDGNINDLGIYASKCILNINNQFVDDEINAIAKKTDSTIAEVYDLYFAIHDKKKIKKGKKTDTKEFDVINLSQDERNRLQKIASETSGDTGKAKIILACDGKPIVYGFITMLARNLGYVKNYIWCVRNNFKKFRMGYFGKKSKYSEEELTALCDAGYSKKEISEKLGVTYVAVESALMKLGLKIKKIDKRKIDKQKLSDLCEKGLCIKEIAKEMGFHEQAIHVALKRFGLKSRRQQFKIYGSKLVELLEKGLSVRKIAKEFSAHKNGVYEAIKRYGFDYKKLHGTKHHLYRKTVYHVTHPDNMISIMNEGLKPNESGEIFLFDNKEDAARIAILQVFCRDDFALFSVQLNAPQLAKLKEDRVGEVILGKQYFLKDAGCISTKNIHLLDCFRVLHKAS